MADILLKLTAADRAWAVTVQTLIQTQLGGRGSVHLDLPPGGGELGTVSGPGYLVTGIAVCDEPAGEMIEIIGSALFDYSVVIGHTDTGQPEVKIGGPELGKYVVFFSPEEEVPADLVMERHGFIPMGRQGGEVGAKAVGQVEIGGGAPYRISAETEGDVRRKLLTAIGREPAELKVVRDGPTLP